MLITEKEALAKIGELERQGYTWKPLGGNANNEGQIQMLTDPASGLAERITNAIDAILEKYYLILDSSAKRPDELANQIQEKINSAKYFNEMILVSIHKSKSKKQDQSISIVIDDKGIGVSGDEFEETILKLGGDNKLSKKYLMGAYGQGGSTSVKFNEYTIIYSKTEHSKEAMTIIRYNIGTEETKNGSYEYIVKNTNGHSQFASSSILKEPGTKIINVATYFKKNFNKIQFKAICRLLANRLFHPPLPFKLIDNRINALIKPSEVIKGARKKLEQDTKDPNCFEHKKIKTNQGSNITLRWWVVMPRKNERLQNLVDSYLKDPHNPFNFTMNGQTQGYYTNILLDEVELSFLKKRFVCEIDLTNISKEEKRSIFSSSRENISKDSSFWEEIKGKIIKYFLNCQKIQDINSKIREMMTSIKHNDKDFNKQLSKALKSIVSSFSKGHMRPPKETSLLDQKAESNNKKEEDLLKIFPSYFNFKGVQPIEFKTNTLKLRYETDGMPRIILEKIKMLNLPNCLNLIDKKQDGKIGVIRFDATKAPVNENLKITFDILNGSFIRSVVVRKIDPLQKPKKPGYPKTTIIAVTKVGEPNYNRLGFNKQIPSKIEYSKINNKLTIYINFADYIFISKYLKNQKILERFKDHYSMGLSIYIISIIRKYDNENSELDDEYDYNPIAKNLIWTFEMIQKIK